MTQATCARAQSSRARSAGRLVDELQHSLVAKLEELVSARGEEERFVALGWLRDGGAHGGGLRWVKVESQFFNRASVNVSGIYYDDLPERRLLSATALSTIIHPQNPHAPSFHMHISYTEMKEGVDDWRIMADLNPALPKAAESARFRQALAECAASHHEQGVANGDRYFRIDALQRHRGVAHFYLEGHSTGDFARDREYARQFGQHMLGTYAEILGEAVANHPSGSSFDTKKQLHYHSVYFLQVLTLDRGTTSGLLVHNQNDVGILASLPGYVSKKLLATWIARLPWPQDKLLGALIRVLPNVEPTPVSDDTRAHLAKVVRAHYQAYPAALAMQAQGNRVPPTLQNHR